MPEWFNRENIFTTLSLLIAGLFGWGFLTQAGFPPVRIQENWIALVVTLIFFILPFAKKLDFFQFFSFEAKLNEVKEKQEETKEKVKEVQDDIRAVLSQQQNLSSVIHMKSNNAQSIYIGSGYDRPPESERQEAKKSLAAVKPVATVDTTSNAQIMSWLNQNGFRIVSEKSGKELEAQEYVLRNPPFAALTPANKLILTRTQIEGVLKHLLRELDVTLPRGISQRNMILTLMDYHPALANHREAFDVFFRVANAVVHAEKVPHEDVDEANFIGERLLAVLQSL